MSNTKIESFIKKNKEAQHNQLLESLGLYEIEKEYAPEDYNSYQANMMGYNLSETVEGTQRYFKNGEKVFPILSDDEYETLLKISLEKERIQEKREAAMKKNNPDERPPYAFSINAMSADSDNFAVGFMKLLSWVLWIGGLIVSFLSASVSVSGSYYSSDVFQWPVFFSSLILYFVSGAVCMCMAKVFENIQTIASAIQHFKVNEDMKMYSTQINILPKRDEKEQSKELEGRIGGESGYTVINDSEIKCNNCGEIQPSSRLNKQCGFCWKCDKRFI